MPVRINNQLPVWVVWETGSVLSDQFVVADAWSQSQPFLNLS